MKSSIARFVSASPTADYVELVRFFEQAWGHELGVEDAELFDGAVVCREVPAELLGLPAGHKVRVDIWCRPLFRALPDLEVAPEVIGRAVDVLAHPLGDLGDLGGLDVLTKLAWAAGAEPVAREGWVWALQLPGLSWILGVPERAPVVYGVSEREETPAEPTARERWREAVVGHLTTAAVAVGQAEKLPERLSGKATIADGAERRELHR